MMISPTFRHLLLAIACGLLACSGAAHAQSSATLIRAAELKAEPFSDAATSANLAADSPLTVIDGKGGWSKVRTRDGKTGWVRLLNVRLAATASDASMLDRVGGVVRTGTTKSAATTGVKGLSREDIARAVPNPDEARKLDNYRPKAGEIERFAAARKLAARDVAELKP